ncbi:Do family serine endopeptidase [Anaerobaca lacustris]|uniref:Do family serine endopeptidase n=1 Tax=Anaerobaca lacustris TaxID=3044600 RepID=A0AAW6TY08_9BACT|nr:Do family serine endopeptidase [Sedimentisphaerales bacterium M17dextr]
MVVQTLGGFRKRAFLSAPLLVVLLVLLAPVSTLAADDQSIAALRQMGKAFASIADKASPGVVGIQATRTVRSRGFSRDRSGADPFEDDLFRYFFGPRQAPRGRDESESRQVSQGSGFVISPDGYILTNNHLVGGAETVTVQLSDGRKVTAEIVGADPETDVAVVKIDRTDLPYIELADSGTLEVGEWVIAIGNPFGLSHTVTAGIVSAKGRSRIGVADYEDFIQTDAAINMGNSGGPLLNLDGKAVGINTAIIGPGGNVGIGLAIPSNMARDIYTQLKESGEVVRGFLGVSLADLEPGMGEYFKLDDDRGVVITTVIEGSAAEKAGIKPDDVVVEFEGEPVTSLNDFRNRVAMYKPGSRVQIVVMREGKRTALTAVLDAVPESRRVAGSAGRAVQESLGMTLQTLTEELASRLGYEDLAGVVAMEVRPGSPAADAGIRAGTLIMEVNRKPVRSVREFEEAIDGASADERAMLRVRDEAVTRLLMIRLPKK